MFTRRRSFTLGRFLKPKELIFVVRVFGTHKLVPQYVYPEGLFVSGDMWWWKEDEGSMFGKRFRIGEDATGPHDEKGVLMVLEKGNNDHLKNLFAFAKKHNLQLWCQR